jgi:hypothetical protein
MAERKIDVVISAMGELPGAPKPHGAGGAGPSLPAMPGQTADYGNAAPATMAEMVYSPHTRHEEILRATREYNDEYLSLLSEAMGKEIELNARKTELVKSYAMEEMDFKLHTARESFAAAATLMNNLYTLSGSKNKALFKVMKGFAVAQALVDAYAGFNRALASLPFPANVAAAASVLAAGMAKVKAIQSTEIGGAAGGRAMGTPVRGGVGMPDIKSPAPLSSEPAGRQAITVNVHALDPSSVNWNTLVENNIAPALETISGKMNVALNIKVLGANA